MIRRIFVFVFDYVMHEYKPIDSFMELLNTSEDSKKTDSTSIRFGVLELQKNITLQENEWKHKYKTNGIEYHIVYYQIQIMRCDTFYIITSERGRSYFKLYVTMQIGGFSGGLRGYDRDSDKSFVPT